jgi:hypothetical protein
LEKLYSNGINPIPLDTWIVSSSRALIVVVVLVVLAVVFISIGGVDFDLI